MKQYVAGLLFGNVRTRVMLIRKDHPQWQAGKLNAIGGKIEPGESPIIAMQREFQEETSLHIDNLEWKYFATLFGTVWGEEHEQWSVDWFVGGVPHSQLFKPQGSVEEPVNWFIVENVIRGVHGPIMPNLSWFIHMAIVKLDNVDRANSFRIHECYIPQSLE